MVRRLSDNDFLDLAQNDSTIRAECLGHLWTAELASLLQILLDQTPKQTRSLNSWIEDLLPQAQIFDAADAAAVQQALEANQCLFLAGEPSNTSDAGLGQELTSAEQVAALATEQQQRPLRVIALPNAAIHALRQTDAAEVVKTEIIGNTSVDDATRSRDPKGPTYRPPV